jgi:hypothetical protein
MVDNRGLEMEAGCAAAVPLAASAASVRFHDTLLWWTNFQKHERQLSSRRTQVGQTRH